MIQGLTVFFHYYFFSPYKRGSSVTPSSSPLKKSGGSPAQKKGIRQDLRNAFGRPGQDEDETEESEEDDENQKSKKVTYFFPIQFFFNPKKFCSRSQKDDIRCYMRFTKMVGRQISLLTQHGKMSTNNSENRVVRYVLWFILS